MEILFFILFFSHLIFLTIVLVNFLSAPKLYNLKKDNEDEKISILIPARNEENNIEKVIKSVLQQNLNNYELIILDDNSTDNTLKITKKFESAGKVSSVKGEPLPQGWLGKNWACYQLSKLASGKILIFIDADVYLDNNAISYSLWLMKKYNIDMLTIFPTQLTNSLGEKMTVPLMNWLLLTFLPLIAVFKSKRVSLNAANGQFILIKNEIYETIGTHSHFKNKVVEDMEMAKSVKKNKYRVMTGLGNSVVFTEMYSSFCEGFRGFSKNFYPGFNLSKPAFLLLILLLLISFLLPFALLFTSYIYIVIIVLIFLQRVLISIISKENPLFNIFMHPFQMILMFIIGINSAFSRKKIWKNRPI